MNRLPSNQEPEDEKQKRISEETQRRISSIMDAAALIYDLMAPGMTIEIKLEEPPAIIAPNVTPKVKRLYITRPLMCLEIKE